jgi:hypothetical protein
MKHAVEMGSGGKFHKDRFVTGMGDTHTGTQTSR